MPVYSLNCSLTPSFPLFSLRFLPFILLLLPLPAGRAHLVVVLLLVLVLLVVTLVLGGTLALDEGLRKKAGMKEGDERVSGWRLKKDGREGRREGGREGRREGETKGEREGGKEGGRKD